MRAPLLSAACIAAAVIAEAFVTAPHSNAASPSAGNSAHVCGDTRLSSTDQADCRAQMDAAKTEGERLKVQGNFEKLSSSVTGEASTNARRNTPTKTTSPPTPTTNPSTAPADTYPPSEAKPPVYPGEVPNPKTGRPPA